MDGSLVEFDQVFMKAVISKGLISEPQLALVQTQQSQRGLGFLAAFIKEEILDNDLIIQILHSDCKVPLLCKSVPNIKIISGFKFEDYVQNGYFIYEDQNKKPVLAINNVAMMTELLNPGIVNDVKIVLIKKIDFYFFLEQAFSKLNQLISINFLEFISSRLTAKNISYKTVAMIFFSAFFTIILNSTPAFHLICNLCYFLQNAFKVLLFSKSVSIKCDEQHDYKIPNFPVYSILIPLYKEEQLLDSILYSIESLQYPKNKLDVKIIIEEDDHALIEKIKNTTLPNYVHIIKVPHSLPKTKPKALNYAIQYATGEYLVVYDAEDRPESDQLLKAVALFNQLPEEYACLQARLNFYNKDENLLSKFFSIEYHHWFDYLLRGLSRLDLPVPLGGTSNHFRTAVLRKVGRWDAYNVTEDADLGLRLYIQGYRVSMLNSRTMEESPLRISSWINQRSRWIKGFIQTFLVFLKQNNSFKKLAPKQFMAVIIFVGISVYNFFCLPWIIVFIQLNTNELLNYLWLFNSFFAFTYLYGISFYILINEKAGNSLGLRDWASFILWPFYFILHTLACYKAIWELCTSPFRWNKTTHGLTKL